MPEVERPDEVALRRLEADRERARLLRSQPKEGREADFGVRTAYLRGFIEPWNKSQDSKIGPKGERWSPKIRTYDNGYKACKLTLQGGL